jgi:hypothetical protein
MSSDNINTNDFLITDQINAINLKDITPPVPLSADEEWIFWENAFHKETYCNVSIDSGIPTVLTTDFTPEMADAISKVAPESVGLGPGNNYYMACGLCRNRLSKLLRMRSSKGKSFFMTGPKENYPDRFMPLWYAARTGAATAVLVVKPSQFGMFSTGKWNHFSIGTVTTVPEIKDGKKRQRLLDKYIPMMTNLFTKNGVPGIHTGMDTLIATLPNVVYGGQLLESAIWFRKHIIENFCHLNRMEQLNVLTAAIFDLNYCTEVGSGDVTLSLYHQLSNNTLDALATCDSVPELTALLKDRLSPINYQVKTADASVGQVDMAIKHIGDFGTELMTLASALKHGAVEVKHPNINSASTAFAKMRGPPGGPPIHIGAAGFATRSNADVKLIQTMNDLMKKLPENLEVSVSGLPPVYATDFIDLKKGVYKTPFSWCFINGQSPSVFNMNGWHKVVAILPMLSNFLFICEGALADSSNMEACCHVSLLTAGYNKSCGSAFGNLNKHLKLQINGNGPFAIGVGVSLDSKKLNDPNPPINGSITLRSGGTEFVIR